MDRPENRPKEERQEGVLCALPTCLYPRRQTQSRRAPGNRSPSSALRVPWASESALHTTELLSDFQRHLLQEKEAFASRNDNSTPWKVPRANTYSPSPPGGDPVTPPNKTDPPPEKKKNVVLPDRVPDPRLPGAELETEPPFTMPTVRT